MVRFTCLVVLCLIWAPRHAVSAQSTDEPVLGDVEEPLEVEYGAEATVPVSEGPNLHEAESRVTRPEMDERIPRSTPDALRYEPGVSVQQTAHAQASPYVRGLTGQQVVHVFDGVRLNNGVYRQGPNQYFFTVDSRTVEELRIIRGSASTHYGSDALGGAIIALPLTPPMPSFTGEAVWEPRLVLGYRLADRELGGRAEVGVGTEEWGSAIFGGGYRDVSRLRAGGVVFDPVGGAPAIVPRFEESVDHPTEPERWRTQLGTGFREATFDARWVRPVGDRLRTVAAVYGYRQYDAPRTDQCPPPEAPRGECLWIDEQFRTLALVALRGDAGPIKDLDLTLSYQRHHERRRRDRPRSLVRFDWLDVVDTYGASLRAQTAAMGGGERGHFQLAYGADAYQDRVQSDASQTLTDIEREFPFSRGQYLEGSRYVSLGAFAEGRYEVGALTLRAGGRAALVGIDAPADAESGTRGVRQRHSALVANAGISYELYDRVRIALAYDQGFRSPNLDDLTSRQQTGPGFQFENPELRPERSHSLELGLEARRRAWRASIWAFGTFIQEAITRDVRSPVDCPPSTPQCLASRTQFQLVNAVGQSRLFGLEAAGGVYLDLGMTVRATLSWVWGDGPDLGSESDTLRVPLSRVPPLGGTVEATYRHSGLGLSGGVALRWAALQDRLAPSDANDARIPVGGTPGYAVFDIRLGWRYRSHIHLALVWENIANSAYRVHGSSVNGPGTSININSSFGF